MMLPSLGSIKVPFRAVRGILVTWINRHYGWKTFVKAVDSGLVPVGYRERRNVDNP